MPFEFNLKEHAAGELGNHLNEKGIETVFYLQGLKRFEEPNHFACIIWAQRHFPTGETIDGYAIACFRSIEIEELDGNAFMRSDGVWGYIQPRMHSDCMNNGRRNFKCLYMEIH